MYKRIPRRYLNTVLHFFREQYTTDSVGESDVTLIPVYHNVPASLQPASPEEIDYAASSRAGGAGELLSNMKVANINDGVSIKQGDIAYDVNTNESYTVVGIGRWNNLRKSNGSVHHYKLLLESRTGSPNPFPSAKTLRSKGVIIKP